MATTVGQHTVATFTSPVNGTTPIDANTVRGNDNTLRTSYNDHDSDTGIHVQSSTLASRPVAGTAGRKWITVDVGGDLHLWYDNGTTWEEVGNSSVEVLCIANSDLTAGDVVKVVGFNNGQGLPIVDIVSSGSDVGFGVVDVDIANGSTGYVVNTGIARDFDTSTFSVGDILYKNASGGFTTTKPTSGEYQPCAYVLRSNVNNGVVYVEFSAPRIVERSDNTASTIVLRDASGNFAAGTITAGALTSTGLVTFASLKGTGATTVTNILDEDNMASNSATALATQQSIKAYVDSQVATVDTLAEILVNGNTSGGTNLIMSAGDTLTADTIAETTVGAGVTIDSVLLKDDVVNATDIEVGTISANDGVQSAVIANTTGVMTIASSVLTTTDINGGTVDGAVIGGASAAAGTFTTLTANTNMTIAGDLTVDTTTLKVDATNNRVGIGTASPASSLEVVYGSGDGAIRIDQNETANGLYFTGRTGYDDYSIELSSGQGLRFFNRTDGQAEMQLRDGYVGIGTTSPGSLLHMYKASGDSVLRIENTGNGNSSGIDFYRERLSGTGTVGASVFIDSNTSNNDAALYIQSQSAGAQSGVTSALAAGNGARIKVGPAATITFETGSSERMRIDASGNVGIGTAAPDSNLEIHAEGANATRQLLHVNSTLTSGTGVGSTLSYPASITSTVSGGTAISRVMNWVKIDSDSANNNTVMNRNLISTDSGTTYQVGGMDLYSSNYYDASRRALFVHSSDVPIWFTAASNISSQTGESDDIYVQMALTTAGNVGIGTTSPGYKLEVVGDVNITGALSKGSGSFKIEHPLPAKADTHNLVHSFIEGPRADLIYRGIVNLVDGFAEVDLDEAATMTTGTWELLCRDAQAFVQNESGWSLVRGSVSGSTLTINAQDNTSTDTVSWIVVAERKDAHMMDTNWTDDNGRVIVEPLKEIKA